MHSIELVEFYVGPPYSIFDPLSERMVAEKTRIHAQDIQSRLFSSVFLKNTCVS